MAVARRRSTGSSGSASAPAAVRALEEGESGVMVALDPPTVNYVPLAEATSRLKAVPLDCDTLLTAARDMGINFGDAMPLPDDPSSWGVPSTHWEEIGGEPYTAPRFPKAVHPTRFSSERIRHRTVLRRRPSR